MMATRDSQRITLVTGGEPSPTRPWNVTPAAPSRIIPLHGYNLLVHTLQACMGRLEGDVERVILDRSTDAAEFLDVLASLPPEFTGDALLIREDGSAFLS